ncbi:fumarylacetoacetate hydrolase family protein [Hydrogenophaga sp.]|jgi:2-keto-4-pentenoate hydratase/2-oxohepta-3-ene-1,7-dioic acid hydratase in catechol pathway|uniref:fumarylacetoacetate hydrolase family protein n=1 Tax=Hydrogenophaga sp. TaxID=1904254 RepID=UPI003F72A11D
MKLATLVQGESLVLASVDSERQTVRRLIAANGQPLTDMNALIENFDALRSSLTLDAQEMPFAQVRFAAPIPRPRRNVICVGKNYREHAQEFTRSGFDSSASKAADAIPTAPIVFTKMPETVIATGEAVRYPTGASDQMDYEAELGVIIGQGGRDIAKASALDHVFGYVILNDVTARDRQATHKQWFLGKSLDTFCPMGPWIATRDELDGTALNVKCWINGELRQNANTRDLIFDIPTLIATISAGLTLRPGDVIATGTPAGVGIGFSPPRFLQRGDVMDIEIDGLGRLSNPIA